MKPQYLIHTNKVPKACLTTTYGALTMPFESWSQGYKAGETGMGCDDCPYETHSREAWAWSSGYIEGRAQAKKRFE